MTLLVVRVCWALAPGHPRGLTTPVAGSSLRSMADHALSSARRASINHIRTSLPMACFLRLECWKAERRIIMTVAPACRNYETTQEARRAWAAGKTFRVLDATESTDRRTVNRDEADRAGGWPKHFVNSVLTSPGRSRLSWRTIGKRR